MDMSTFQHDDFHMMSYPGRKSGFSRSLESGFYHPQSVSPQKIRTNMPIGPILREVTVMIFYGMQIDVKEFKNSNCL